MALISKSIPNLINGVSQQPPSIRLVTQGEVQENGLSSVVSGLSKRPPTQHIAKIGILDDLSSAFIHTVRRDENEFYTLIIRNGTLNIYDNEGVQRTVSGSLSYLTGLDDPATELAATTIADFTFICNKKRTVLQGTATTPSRPFEAMVYVKQGDYATDYKINLSSTAGSAAASKTTLDNSASANASDIRTNKIATDLFNSLTMPPGISKELYDNVIYLYSNTVDFTVSATDSKGDRNIFAFKGTAKDIADLPPKAISGFKIKIVGDGDGSSDDWWAVYDNADGTPVWRESVAPSIPSGFNASTMPHQLVKQPDGSFVFQAATWDTRAVGDEDTNPIPSFVGNTINDVFFHRNRLGFLSDENVIFSEASNYYNFFAPSIVARSDAAPIDVAVSNNQVSILKHAIPFNESLLIFSDLTQFVLKADQLLTPDTVSIDVATQFETSTTAKPVAAGRYVFFAINKGKWSGIREYYVEDGTDSTTNSAEITAQVPSYLLGTVRKLTTSSNQEMLLAITKDDPTAVYAYRWYWSGREKLISSWSKWKFNGTVLNVDFNNSDVTILINRNDGVCLERINLSQDEAVSLTTGSFGVNLDRRVIFPAGSEDTTLPYVDTNVKYVSASGRELALFEVATTALTETVFAGVPYTFKYQFSEQIMAAEKAPITIGRLQMRNMNVVYNGTGFFKAKVTAEGRDTKEYVFTGRILGSSENILGVVALETGTFKFPVLSRSDQVKITIESDNWLPCFFQSAEWEGFYTLRSRRM